LAMSAVAFSAGGNLTTGVREGQANRWVICGFCGGGLASASAPAWSDCNELWVIDGDAVRWLGVILFVPGGALRIWPVYVLGNRFRGDVAVTPSSPPAFTASFATRALLVNGLGWGLAFRPGVLLAALLFPLLLVRIILERALLQAQFGVSWPS
jgi:hypothetical protein